MAAPEYEEVIKLILATDTFNTQLKATADKATKAMADLSQYATYDVKIKADSLELDLKKILLQAKKAEEDKQKELLKIKEAALKKEEEYIKSSVLKSFNDSIAKNKEAEIAKQAEIKKTQEVREAKKAQEIADLRAEYRVFQEIEASKRAEIKRTQELYRQSTQFANIFTPAGKPLPIASTPSSVPTSVNASAALRTGAGIAASLGSYPAAGALYASANAAQVLNINTIALTGSTIALGSALAGAGAAAAVLFAGKDFNIELAKMSTLLADATTNSAQFSAMLDNAANSAVRLAGEFNMGTVDVIKAFKEALSSGIESVDLERFTRQAATLATSLGTGLSESANILTSFKDSYQLTVGDMSKVNDLLFNVVNVGKVNVNELVNNFGRLLPVGKAAGVSLEDLGAGVALLTRRGMTASQSITSMIQVINGLVSPSNKAQKELDALGIATGDAAFKTKSLVQVIDEISLKTGDSGSILGKLFEEERARRGITALTDGVDLLGKLRKAMDETGTASVAADRAMDTFWTHLGQKWTSIYGEVQKAGSGLANLIDTAMFGSKDARDHKKQEANAELDAYIRLIQEKIKSGITDNASLIQAAKVSITDARKNIYGNPNASKEDVARAKLGDASDDTLNDAIAKAQAIARDASDKTANSVIEDYQRITEASGKWVEQLTKLGDIQKQTKLDEKEFNSRATDNQKQRILDIKEEIEDKQELLKKEKELQLTYLEGQIAYRKATFVTPIADARDEARKSGNGPLEKQLTAELESASNDLGDFAFKARKSLENSHVFQPMIDDINRLQSGMQSIRVEASQQDTRKDTEAKKKAAEHDASEYKKIFQKLYDDDINAYTASIKKRESVITSSNKRIESEMNRSNQLQASIVNNISNAQQAQFANDPDRQRRISREKKEQADKNIQDFLAGGNGSRSDFDKLAKEYEENAKNLKDATERVDQGRGNKNYQDDESVLLGYNSQFDSKFRSQEKKVQDEAANRTRGLAVRSQGDLTRAADKEFAANKEVEKVTLEATVKLQIDGTLSNESKEAIAKSVMDKIDQSRSNRNRSTKYDPATRGSRNSPSYSGYVGLGGGFNNDPDLPEGDDH